MIRRAGRGSVLHQAVERGGVLHIGGVVADDPSLGMYEQTRQALGKLAGPGSERVQTPGTSCPSWRSSPTCG